MKKSWKSSIIGRWDDGRDVARDEKFCCFPRKTAFLHHSFTKNKQSWSFSMATTAFLSREKRRKRVILTFPRVGKAGFFRFLMILSTEFAVFSDFWWFRPRNPQFFPFSDDSVHGICSFQRFLMIPSTESVVFSVFWWKRWQVLAPDGHFCKKRWQVLLPNAPHSMNAWGMLPSSTSICNPLLIYLLVINVST